MRRTRVDFPLPLEPTIATRSTGFDIEVEVLDERRRQRLEAERHAAQGEGAVQPRCLVIELLTLAGRVADRVDVVVQDVVETNEALAGLLHLAGEAQEVGDGALERRQERLERHQRAERELALDDEIRAQAEDERCGERADEDWHRPEALGAQGEVLALQRHVGADPRPAGERVGLESTRLDRLERRDAVQRDGLPLRLFDRQTLGGVLTAPQPVLRGHQVDQREGDTDDAQQRLQHEHQDPVDDDHDTRRHDDGQPSGQYRCDLLVESDADREVGHRSGDEVPLGKPERVADELRRGAAEQQGAQRDERARLVPGERGLDPDHGQQADDQLGRG